MLKLRNLSIWLIALYGLAACAQRPVVSFEVITPAVSITATPPVESPTPWAEGTEMALASPTPWVDGTQTALAATQNALATSTPPAVTQEVIAKPTDFSPVLYGGKLYDSTFFLLLGGAGKDEWLAPDESVARFSGEVTYSLNSMTQKAKYFLWGKAPEYSNTCKMYSIGTEATLDEGGFVAVVDGWEVAKRDVAELSADGQLYQQAVIDWLKTQGLDSPEIGDLHVFRADLEGDGTDEIFISATHLDESLHTTKAGDYSIVLMRKVSGNEVITKLVVGDLYDSKEPEITYPRTYSLANFIDLNQDGVLEVVVSFLKWEGFGASVFQVDGQNVTQTLSSGC